MKRRLFLLCLVMVAASLWAVCGFTGARFYSSATVTGIMDSEKIPGSVSLYHPEWVSGYDTITNCFSFPEVNTTSPNIRFSVTNKLGDVVNQIEQEYYVRVVDADRSSANLPISYTVHANDHPESPFPMVAGIGYGPFTLAAGTEATQIYAIEATWISVDPKHTADTQSLKIQLIKKRTDGTLKIINEEPLNMRIGRISNVQISYYNFDKLEHDRPVSLLSSYDLYVEPGTTIYFTDPVKMAELGVPTPAGYSCGHALGKITGYREATEITIPTDAKEKIFIEAHCADVNLVVVTINYKKATQTIKTQYVEYRKGEGIIDFNDAEFLAAANLPADVAFDSATCADLAPVSPNRFEIPADFVEPKITINAKLRPSGTVTPPVIARIYNANNQAFIGEVLVEPDADGNFTFSKDSLGALHPELAGKTSFSIGIQNGTEGYNITEIGNPAVTPPSVMVDYTRDYNNGYSLWYDGMYLYIGYWW